MTDTHAPRILLLEGNATVRRLMSQALGDSGFEVLEARPDAVGEQHDFADLLIVDIDSGLSGLDAWRVAYADRERPVLACGVRPRRDDFDAQHWLGRPFAPEGLVTQCRHLLDAPHIPPGLHGLEQDSTPETQKLTFEDAAMLEDELGLEKGALSQSISEAEDFDELLDIEHASAADTTDEDDSDPFVEVDSSSAIVLDVDDLEDVHESIGQGGARAGAVRRQRLQDDDLEWEELAVETPPPALRSSSLNKTMPDAPAVIAPEGVADDSGPEPFPPAPLDEAPSSHGSVVDLPPNLERHVDQAADLLANSWGRIGLSARTRDRADHIRKVLRAILSEGLTAAAAEIDRIPAAQGFSGSLGVMDLGDLLTTIQERGLRGRLELSIGRGDFLVYLDADILDGIENLSENDEARLLDVLFEMGCLSPEIYDELADSLSDDLAAPLQMRLRQDQLVGVDDLRRARQRRAVRLFQELRAVRTGSFAFMEIGQGTGHAWPVDGLSLPLDRLLDAASREDSSVTDPTAATRPALSATDMPTGLEIDEHLPVTVEVPEPDDEL